MKIKIRKDKITEEMNVEYFKVPDKAIFRYKFIKNLVGQENDVTLIVDTNQCSNPMISASFGDALKQSGIDYSMFPIEADKTKFFGLSIDISHKKKEEKLFTFNIDPEQFTQMFFKSCIENFDIGIGIGRKEAFSDIFKHQNPNVDNILFNDAFFEKSIYDSILCSSIRSSFDIESYLEV